MQKILKKNVFSFWDNIMWIGCVKLTLLRREYLSSAVNVLNNGRKILHITKTYSPGLNCFHDDQ